MKFKVTVLVFVFTVVLAGCFQRPSMAAPTRALTITSTNISTSTLTATGTVTPTVTHTFTPEPTATITNTPTPEPVDMIVDLELDDIDDLEMFELPYEDFDQQEQPPSEVILYDGVIHLGGNSPIDFVNPKPVLYHNYLVHLRARTGKYGPCFAMGTYFQLEEGRRKVLSLSGCPNNNYTSYAWLDDGKGGGTRAWLEAWGAVPVIADEWVDMVLWLHPDGNKVFFAFSNTSDPIHIIYGGASLPDHWQSSRWKVAINGYMYPKWGTEDQYLDVEFLKFAEGDLGSYLYYNFPAYMIFKEEIDLFLIETPPIIDESKFGVWN